MENKKVTQEDINRTVWKACDTFRGVIDPSQYKDYILTMLFLKYVSDVYKSKLNDYLVKYEGDRERAERAMRHERFVVLQQRQLGRDEREKRPLAKSVAGFQGRGVGRVAFGEQRHHR